MILRVRYAESEAAEPPWREPEPAGRMNDVARCELALKDEKRSAGAPQATADDSTDIMNPGEDAETDWQATDAI